MFALLACALIGLWVRSYYRVDTVSDTRNGSYDIGYGSIRGVIQRDVGRPRSLRKFTEWKVVSRPLDPRPVTSRWQYGILWGLGFHFGSVARFIHFKLPIWVLVAISATLATLFAIKRTWRFTIRTLLIATTLVAAALGLGVYLL